jgi:hypothetical protein
LAPGEVQRRALQVARDLLVQPRAAQRVGHRALELGRSPATAPARGMLGQGVGDVVEDAHRERVRLLKDHRHPPSQVVDLERMDVFPVERDAPAARGARGDLGEAVERA